MTTPFGKVGIYGVGLIGGSLGLALRSRKLAESVHGIGRNPERLQKALELGAIDSFSVASENFPSDLEILVLGTPLSIYASVLSKIREHLSSRTVVTDVGSAQLVAAREMEAGLPPGIAYVGAHPMAGGERTGFEAAQEDLFEGAVCALCPTARTTPASLERIHQLWRSVGCHAIVLDAEKHDYFVGWTSHLPHIVAAALAKAVAEFVTSHPQARDFLGPGFGDTTRIASGDPTMWHDICRRNEKNLTAGLRRFRDEIDAYLQSLESAETDKLFHMFSEAKRGRDGLVGNDSKKS
jgi:prephenate dehydrogenase